jgi:hypothetical protein
MENISPMLKSLLMIRRVPGDDPALHARDDLQHLHGFPCK